MVVATEVPEALAESNPDSGTKMICCVYISLHSLDALDTLPHLIPGKGKKKNNSLCLAQWHEKQFTAMKSKEVSQACMKRTGCL